MKRFRDYLPENGKWITFVDSGYYPDSLEEAKQRYTPILNRFSELVRVSSSSQELFLRIVKGPSASRVQLLRIFRKYVSPDTSVEMMKRVGKANDLLEQFGDRFRPIE